MYPLTDEILTFSALEILPLRSFEAFLLMYKGVGFGVFLIGLLIGYFCLVWGLFGLVGGFFLLVFLVLVGWLLG